MYALHGGLIDRIKSPYKLFLEADRIILYTYLAGNHLWWARGVNGTKTLEDESYLDNRVLLARVGNVKREY